MGQASLADILRARFRAEFVTPFLVGLVVEFSLPQTVGF